MISIEIIKDKFKTEILIRENNESSKNRGASIAFTPKELAKADIKEIGFRLRDFGEQMTHDDWYENK